MRISDRLEGQLPLVFCLRSESLGLARNRIDLAACGPDSIHDSTLPVAPQLGATGRSPEAAIENQDDEFVLAEHRIEPASAGTRRRIELGLQLRGRVGRRRVGLGVRNIKAC